MVWGQWVLQALTDMIADESVSWALTTVSWQVHRIYGFSISSSSESNSDISDDTLAVLRSLDDDDDEDPNDVLDDVSGNDVTPVMMMVHDDDWWWQLWCMTNDGSWWWFTMAAMMYDGWWIMTMMYDDDGHGCDQDDRLMMPLELWYMWSLCSMLVMILTWMIEILDSYSRSTWYVWATWVDVLARVVWIVLAWLVRALVDLLVNWRSTIFISHSSSASIFISYSLYQLQLSFFFSIQLLPANYPLPLMPKAERCSGGEMSLLGGACCQLSSMTKGEIVGQFESCMVLYGLIVSYVCHWCQLSLGLRSCPWF